MARPVVFNVQNATNVQNQVSALHPQVQAQITPAVATAHDQANQLQWQLARGIISPDDVRAYKGV